MTSTAKLYASEIKKHFRTLYANWEPGGPIELGDYGMLDGTIFTPLGKLSEDFPEFAKGLIKTQKDNSADHKEFRSEGGVDVSFYAKGSVNGAGTTLAKAAIEVKFGHKDAIFFNAAGCTTDRISNKAKVGEVLKKLFEEKKWKRTFCVVTDLVTAGQTIIAISQGNNSSITVEADSPAVQRINLADAKMGITITSERNIGYKVDAENGLILLLGLCQIKPKFLGTGGDFNVKTITKRSKSLTAGSLKASAITDADLSFIQLGLE